MSDIDRSKPPIRRPAFSGVINRTLDGSQPDWNLIGPPTPPDGAPNVLLVLIDDAGFGNPSTFGGPIQTPNYTRARRGRRALQPLPRHRAVLSDARRAADRAQQSRRRLRLHRRIRGRVPGLLRDLPRDCAPLPRILRDNGYSTAAFGKWHLTPDGQQGPAGPFDRWPNGWGFDYFYGILGGGSSQWDPCLAENQKIIGTDPAFYDDEHPYYFPDAMADRTIEWLHGVRAQDAHKPFFVVLLDRLQPCSAPRREGMGRQVQGQVRPGLGQAPRGDVRAPEGTRGHSRRCGAHAARRSVPGVG